MSSICQACGKPGPTRKVQFHKHTGMVIMMRHGYKGGHFCKRCIQETFMNYTGWTAVAGWWGMISFFVTPCVLTWNTGLYLTTLGMPSGSSVPRDRM